MTTTPSMKSRLAELEASNEDKAQDIAIIDGVGPFCILLQGDTESASAFREQLEATERELQATSRGTEQA